MPFEKGNKLWEKANHKGHEPTFSRPRTDEEKTKISKTMCEWHQTHQNPRKGKNHSDETKKRMSQCRQGNKNSNWRGGLTAIIKGIRRSPEYYQWRKSVLERDGDICRDCGSTSKLDAHHIKSIWEYPKLIFDMNNGLTLCQNCHKRHSLWQKLNGKRKIKFQKQKLSGAIIR
jgi:hypothetical protein